MENPYQSESENKKSNEDEKLYKRAQKRVREIKGFYIHFLVYVIVNVGLFAFNLLISPGQLWFYWTTLGWGIGIAAHALSVFGMFGIFGDNWEQDKIREYMEKHSK